MYKTFPVIVIVNLNCQSQMIFSSFPFKCIAHPFLKVFVKRSGYPTLVNVYVDLLVFTRIAGTS